MDITEWHTGEPPPNSNMVIVAIRGVGNSVTVCRACYTAAWGKWHRAGSNAEVHPLGWAYLIKWEGNDESI